MSGLRVPADPYDWPILGPTEPEHVALLVIDLQHDFLSDDGWLARTAGRDVARLRDAVPGVTSLLEVARQIPGLHVVHTRQGNAPDLSDLPPTKREQSFRAGWGIGSTGPYGRGLIRGEPGWQIDPVAAPAPGERIVDKPGFCAFVRTDLDGWLRERDVRSLILTGVTANVCVLSTLYAAVDLGYDCLTVRDAIGGIDDKATSTVHDLIKYQGGLFGSLAPATAVRDALTEAVSAAPG
jgi:nicotinamidase-related amidase